MTDPKVIPLDGNSTIEIEDQDAPVNLDESIAPTPKTTYIYPPQPKGDDE